MPVPTPQTTRTITSTSKLGGIVEHIPKRKNRIAAIINMGFRPNQSARNPATAAPKMQPTSAELVSQPSANVVRPYWILTCSTVPEITAVSKPNWMPPREATRHVHQRYHPPSH